MQTFVLVGTPWLLTFAEGKRNDFWCIVSKVVGSTKPVGIPGDGANASCMGSEFRYPSPKLYQRATLLRPPLRSNAA